MTANTPTITLADATPADFDAILRIERTTGGGSMVALTEGQALQAALDRGHWLVVARHGDETIGWIWFFIELRGGESVGLISRVAIDERYRRRGAGSSLVAHARGVFVERECTRVRVTIDGEDAGARAFFARAGFAVDAVSMELAV